MKVKDIMTKLRATAEAFARRLMDAGLQPGDRLAIWSDNRPEWVAAFWGCMLRGIAVIPFDARAATELVRRIVVAAAPRGVVVGDEIDAPAASPSLFVTSGRWKVAKSCPNHCDLFQGAT